MNLDTLKTQLAAAEDEFEKAKAVVYRYDGAIQLLKKLIADAQAAESEG